MKKVIQPFIKFINSLVNNGNISIEENNLPYTIDKAERMDIDEFNEWILEDSGIQISKEHLDYMFTSGLTFNWTNEKIISSENTFIYGGFFLRGVYEPIATPSRFWEVYNDPVKDKNHENDLNKLGYFQRSAHGDDGAFGCFYRDSKNYPFPIYFYDNGIFMPMSLNLDEYYKAMISCKAVVLWQYFFIDTNDIINYLKDEKCSNWISLYDDLPGNPSRIDGLIKHMEVLIKQFPILFPDADISLLENKRNDLINKYEK